VRLRFIGANAKARIEGLDPLTGKSNYFIGRDPSRWRTSIPQYRGVRYRGLYPGVDLVYYGSYRQLEYDLVIAPGTDPGVIQLEFLGVESVRVDARGDAVLRTADGEIRQHRPVAYQRVNGEKKLIAGWYVRQGNRRVAFRVSGYDHSLPLVIDPAISYCTFLGGTGVDSPSDVAVDASGHAYVVGLTTSTDFPVTRGAIQPTNRGGGSDTAAGVRFGESFIAKLNPSGTALVYCTYLGGGGEDQVSGIAVDLAGNAYLTGTTTSADFPITPGVFQSELRPRIAGFVAKLNAAGNALVYSTYVNGASPSAITLDAAGNAYITGTAMPQFTPTEGAFQTEYRGGQGDGFLAKLNGTGSALLYATFLGGKGLDGGTDLALDSSGNVYVTGNTSSSDFPLSRGAIQSSIRSEPDVFVAKLDAAGASLLYSTFLGGNSIDEVRGIAVDAAGSAHIAGRTLSTDFPTTPGSIQPSFGGHSPSLPRYYYLYDAFVAKLNAAGTALVYSTYLGGDGDDGGFDIAVDAAGNAWVVGLAESRFPTTPLAIQPAGRAFLAKLNPSGVALIFSTLLGGSGDQRVAGIGLASFNNAYVALRVNNGNFPITPGAFQTVFKGRTDLAVVKVDLSAPSASPDRLDFKGFVGFNIPSQKLTLSALSGETARWTIEAKTDSGGDWLKVSPSSGSGSATVEVSVSSARLPAGAYSGTIAVTSPATGTTTFIRVVLAIMPVPVQISPGGVVNAFSYSTAVAPGSIISVFGTNLASATLQAAASPLPTTLASTSVSIAGRPGPLYFVSPSQINAQVPFEIPPGPATVAVTVSGSTSPPASFTVLVAAPGILLVPGTKRGLVQNQDLSLNGPGNPAAPESVIVAYLTGLGQTDNPVSTGAAAPLNPLSRPVLPATAAIGGRKAEMLFIGLVPSCVGLGQANIVVPALPPGDYPLEVTIGGATSNAVYITISASGR
jgi:uncharacterized protein (TIGR03437 family)